MGWRTRTVPQKRYDLVMDWLRNEVPKAELCRRYGVSRKTACKWVKRLQAEGRPGLTDRSHRPRQHGRCVSEEVVQALLSLKKRYAHWGARKLLVKLKERHGDLEAPSLSTAHRILERAGQTRPRVLKRRVPPWAGKLTVADRANRVWRADYKGEFTTGDGDRCEPLTVTDGKSRYLLVLKATQGTGYRAAYAAFRAAFIRYGLPDVILTDNGNPFVTPSVTGLTRLGVLWAKLGIRHERTDPGCPQQNGSHERFHGTLSREAAQPAAATLAGQARRFSRFQRQYNEERPHEALGQVTPASCYRRSSRRWPRRLPPPIYAPNLVLRRVHPNGGIKWEGRYLYLGEVLRGEQVAIEISATGAPCRVRFYELELGTIEGPTGAKFLQRAAPPPRGRRCASPTSKAGNL